MLCIFPEVWTVCKICSHPISLLRAVEKQIWMSHWVLMTPLAMFAALVFGLVADYANICSLSWHGQKTKDIFWWHTFGHKPLICPQPWALTRFLVSFSVWINEDEPQDLCIGAAVIEWGTFDDECKDCSTALMWNLSNIYKNRAWHFDQWSCHPKNTLIHTLFFVFSCEWECWEAVDNSLNSIQTPIKDSLSSNWWPSLTSAVWLGIMDSDRGVESCVDISNEIIAGHTAPHCHQPHGWPRGLFDVGGGADAGLGGGCLPTIIKYVLINKTWSNCLLSAPLLPISVCSFPRFRTSAFLLGLHQPPGRRLKAAAVKMRQNQTKKRLTGCLNS